MIHTLPGVWGDKEEECQYVTIRTLLNTRYFFFKRIRHRDIQTILESSIKRIYNVQGGLYYLISKYLDFYTNEDIDMLLEIAYVNENRK